MRSRVKSKHGRIIGVIMNRHFRLVDVKIVAIVHSSIPPFPDLVIQIVNAANQDDIVFPDYTVMGISWHLKFFL